MPSAVWKHSIYKIQNQLCARVSLNIVLRSISGFHEKRLSSALHHVQAEGELCHIPVSTQSQHEEVPRM